jgi:hypothetical protein
MPSPSRPTKQQGDSSKASAFPLVTTIVSVIVLVLQYLADSESGAQSKIFLYLKTVLRNGAGIILIPALVAGLVIVVRGLMMERCSCQWKWEIAKGLALIALPAILGLFCAVLFGPDRMP